MLRKILIILLTVLFTVSGINATHNRAGEITLTQHTDDPFTFDILIQTFTYSRSAADRDELEVQWGDQSVSTAGRTQKLSLPNFYFWNQYKASHTFPGPGTYTIVVQDPNRNFGVLNIPNSVNVIFSVKTTIVINTGIGHNSTPVLLNPPIDRAAIGQVFVHNPAAFDPDGDSISYKLTVCTEENGEPISDYSLPLASDSLYIDEITGDLIWNTPVDTGIYNIAIEIEEWRFGVKIGSIARDMQIDVFNTDNRPPVIMPLRDFCVEAGNLLEYDILATDPDSNRITQYATGGPFLFDDSPAAFDSIMTGRGFNFSRFSWQTTCNHVRYQPYNIIVKAEDDHPILQLVDISNFHIKVIGPAPKNPRTTATASSILLEWDTSVCQNVVSYEIYRREGRLGYIPDSCTNGIPSGLDYELVSVIDGRDSTQFTDDNNGEGLIQGIEYCYMIVAIFPDGTPGFPSAEVCGVLTPGNPAVLQASVTDLDTQGSILLSWARPRDLDTIPALGPYEYIIYRSDLDPLGNNLQEIHRFTTSDLDDTSYLDAPINTISFPYSYKVELYNDEAGNRFLIGRQEIVSSTWLEIDETDNANIVRVRKNTPWVNHEYVIYRKGPGSLDYDSIGISNTPSFVDDGLKNGVEYCYRVKTIGSRSVNNLDYTSINLTHFACGTPLDTIAPCPPDLTVESFCDSSYNQLAWTNPNRTCANDVVKYHIYYAQVMDGEMTLIDSTLSADETSYVHFPTGSLAGCYAVTAVDSFNNESNFSILFCVDNCIDYMLPNVFTPNGDGMNDIFRPSNYAYVEKVDMKIYNRWGVLVYQTEDPDINWDGKRMNTDHIVPPGVYYYVCDVFENRLTGLEVRSLSGFVYVFTESDAVNPIEK